MPLIGAFLFIFFAERVGFEPTVQCNPYDDLANRSFRPLRHLSVFWRDGKIKRKIQIKINYIAKYLECFCLLGAKMTLGRWGTPTPPEVNESNTIHPHPLFPYLSPLPSPLKKKSRPGLAETG